MRKLKNLVLVLAGACTAFACLLGSITSPVHAATLPAGFSESIVFSGLTEPTAVRFSPDGRVFVTEKSGLIKVFANLSATTPTVFHDLRTNVHNFWDRGLIGLELHPNFPTVPSVYVLYVYNKDPNNSQVPRWAGPDVTSDPCPTPPGPTTDGCVVSGRLSRLEVSAGSTVSTGTESVLVEGWGQQFPGHTVDTVMFGPDGALYASAGEGASYTFADYGQAGNPRNPLGDPPVGIGGVQTPPTAEGGATRSQSLRRVSGPAVLNGTLIRVDPFTGAGLSDNPRFSSADPNARRIVAYGLRNPFRFTFRPGTNEVWIGDVGWSAWEEIDRIPNPLTSTVSNFGWPCYEGAAQQPSFQALGLNICKSLYTSGSATPPYFAYAALQPVVAGETCPATNGSSISGLAFNSGGTYPASYQGALFFADHSRNCIWSMFAGANGLPDPATRATFVAGAANPVDLQIGPGGDVFYVDFDGGSIRRIKYASGNQAPNAVIQATPLSGPAPLTVTFDGRASSDPNAGDTLTYSWDLNGDGVFGDALTAQTSFTYTQAKLYNVQLKVTDNHGAFDVVRVLISPGNSPPTAFIDAPGASLQWQVGQSITFSGHATDPDQGALPPSAFSWELIMHHCPSNCHTHPIQSFPGVTTASFSAPDHEYYSYLEIKLTVTDAGGLTDTKSLTLNPQTVTLNFESTPSGLQLVVGSSSSPTPFPRTVILGSVNSVSAGTPQTLGGTTYYFASWSDGGNQSHLITGTASVTYAATYSLTLPADITPPTAPATLTTSPISGTQFTLSWPAATDNLGVTSYQVERCQGVGCTTFALIASPTTTGYLDTGLTPGTTYSYRVRAQDATGNVSPYSPIITATTPTATTLAAADNFDRADNLNLGAAWDPYTGRSALQLVGNSVRATINGDNVESYNAVPLPNNQWSQATLTGWNGTIYHNAHVSVRLSTNLATLTGYAGMVDSGNRAMIGKWTAGVFSVLASVPYTPSVGDVWRLEAAGTTLRFFVNNVLLVSTTDASYASGRPGLTIFIGTGGTVGQVQLDNFSANSLTTADTTPPTAPATLMASPISGTQFTLSWPAATDNLGVTSYQVERCQGVGCTTFALIASPTTTGYLDTGLTPGTTYSYRVRAQDATGNVSPYSPIITATTPTATTLAAADNFDRADNLNLGAAWDPYTGRSALQLVGNSVRATINGDNVESYNAVPLPNNQWSQATLTGWNGTIYHNAHVSVRLSTNLATLTGYAGMVDSGNRAMIGKWTAGVFSVLASVPYTPSVGDVWRLEAAGTTLRFFVNNVLLVSTTDASYASGRPGLTIFIGTGGTVGQVQLDNFSANSLTTADTTPPTAPAMLMASPISGTQITLSWPAATDNIGVTGYQVERCQGAGCTTFALLATPTTTSYSDTGLTAGTTYSYRIRARDAVGNLSGNSIIMTATTGGAPAGGLVAAYGFNEGTGITSSDASGNNNTARLNTAIWATQGKFGMALFFDGTSKVTVPDAPSLDLTTGMTLEAWVYPTVAGGGDWPTIMMKETPPNSPYVLYGKVWSPTGPALPGMRANLPRQPMTFRAGANCPRIPGAISPARTTGRRCGSISMARRSPVSPRREHS